MAFDGPDAVGRLQGSAGTPAAARRRAGGTAMKLTMMVAALTLLAVLGGFPLVHAEVPEECRRQCALDLEDCRNACIDSRDFYGCIVDWQSAVEQCLSGSC